MEALKLKGKTSLITGASRGIGRAIALGFAAQGARVAVTARTVQDLDSLVQEIRASGREAVAIPADLLDLSSVAGLVGLAEEELGSLDILVNNAGLGSSSDPRPVVDFDDRFWDRSLALNLTAPYLLCKAVLPSMIRKKRGRIINIASIASRRPQIHGAAYAASKHGLLGLTRTLALEVARDGITVNAICPGPVQTEMNDRRIQYDSGRLGIEFSELEAAITPIGRRLQPPEIVPMAILLASDDSAAITGQAFNICGGMAMS
ncbi:MAG: SDR family NAD(P)-dependent oxidoreductase [Acidobacteria bacterium]|nr:SDR family NAD(P)-dependent oxidoreductase [Acidobacteriota bacterium]